MVSCADKSIEQTFDRQGFGRLIRNKNDFGAVLIFDSRVIHKRYGVKFLNSLPNCTMAFGSAEAIVQGLESFYEDYSQPCTDLK